MSSRYAPKREACQRAVQRSTSCSAPRAGDAAPATSCTASSLDTTCAARARGVHYFCNVRVIELSMPSSARAPHLGPELQRRHSRGHHEAGGGEAGHLPDAVGRQQQEAVQLRQRVHLPAPPHEIRRVQACSMHQHQRTQGGASECGSGRLLLHARGARSPAARMLRAPHVRTFTSGVGYVYGSETWSPNARATDRPWRGPMHLVTRAARLPPRLERRVPGRGAAGGRGRHVPFVRGRDEACPIRTGGGMRRVRSVRGERADRDYGLRHVDARGLAQVGARCVQGGVDRAKRLL
jgi:hypothetical protein